MVYFTEKKIKGKKYLYAVHSVRLGKGRVLKISKRVDKREITPALQDYFTKKEGELRTGAALEMFETNSVFTREQIVKIEKTRQEYKQIISKLTKKQLQDLFDRFTVNFTYESNALEGNSLTLKDVAIVLFEGKVPDGTDLREVYETRNSRGVVGLILKKKFKVKEKDTIKMHEMLVKDMEIETGYKKIPNFLLGRDVETTPPEKVGREMKALIEWFGGEKKMHPLQKAALFHGKFEKIHPFDDGNGRVGRFLINVALVNAGYAPLIIRKSQRTAYLKCLQDYDNGYTTNLERFMLDKYKKTFKKFFGVYVKYLSGNPTENKTKKCTLRRPLGSIKDARGIAKGVSTANLRDESERFG
ncbi:Fic family protein [Candidatus Micrarchaeota archaeon]|nr:Fic family protein [Candidatus Micrarchaeota archaeon]